MIFESQIKAIFDTSPLHQFSKFNNFLWVCWFLGKNLSNFVPPAWKLDKPYYHNVPKSIHSEQFSSAPFALFMTLIKNLPVNCK